MDVRQHKHLVAFLKALGNYTGLADQALLCFSYCLLSTLNDALVPGMH